MEKSISRHQVLVILENRENFACRPIGITHLARSHNMELPTMTATNKNATFKMYPTILVTWKTVQYCLGSPLACKCDDYTSDITCACSHHFMSEQPVKVVACMDAHTEKHSHKHTN